MLASRFGERRRLQVHGPLSEDVSAEWVLDAASGTAYLECAQACGLAVLGGPPTPQTALAAHSRGVGQLIAAALDAGATRIVVGLGGSRQHRRRPRTDRGTRRPATRPATPGRRGADRGLRRRVPAGRAVGRGPGVRPAEGRGSGHGGRARRPARAVGRSSSTPPPAGRSARNPAPGPPAGSARRCSALGGRCESGASIIAEHTGLADDLAAADLVITGEGKFDEQSLRGKVVGALAAAARPAQVPVVVLAGQVMLDEPTFQSAGILRRRFDLRLRRFGAAGPGRCRQPADRAGRADVAARLGNSGATRYL